MMAIYIWGGILFFLLSIPFIFLWSDEADEAFIGLLTSACCAPMWPIVLPIALIVGLGKLLRCF